MQRRDFLAALAAATTPASLSLPSRAQTLDAETTPFYAQPDGRATLVRFRAPGRTAPAGRLRVFGSGRLLGTAGMIQTGDGLYGELWLPLEHDSVITSELEAPGVRGVVRGSHRLRPAPRWSLHWLTIVDPETVLAHLRSLPPIRDSAMSVLLAGAGVHGNALPAAARLWQADHVEFLRMATSAQRLHARYGIPVANVAAVTALTDIPHTTPLALDGSGVRAVVHPWSDGPTSALWSGPGDAKVLLVGVPPGASANALQFAGPTPTTAARVERWLRALPAPFHPATDRRGGIPLDGHLILLDTTIPERFTAIRANIAEWNRRFAFPRLIAGPDESLARWLAQIPTTTTVSTRRVESTAGTATLPGPGVAHVPLDQSAGDEDEAAFRTFAPLAAIVSGADRGAAVLRDIARLVASEFPGTVVFNPTGYRRTDVAVLPDGREFVVTDVPPLGYAFVPEVVTRDAGTPGEAHEDGDPLPHTGSLDVTTETLAVTLDERSGAIASLRTRDDDREWVQEVDGLNAVPGAILERRRITRLRGVGVRFALSRWSREWGTVRSIVTAYDALPWIDVENHAERSMEYYFRFAVTPAEVSWETPAGHDGAPASVNTAHGRWIAMHGDGAVVMASAEARGSTITSDGMVRSRAPAGRARYRLWVGAGRVLGTDAARLAAGTVPLRTAATPGGATLLPRYGSLLRVEPSTVAPLGLKSADDGDGLVLYLLEMSGVPSFAAVGAGVLRFRDARVVDFLERDAGDVASGLEDGVLVSLPASGAVAVRLRGVELRGT